VFGAGTRSGKVAVIAVGFKRPQQPQSANSGLKYRPDTIKPAIGKYFYCFKKTRLFWGKRWRWTLVCSFSGNFKQLVPKRDPSVSERETHRYRSIFRFCEKRTKATLIVFGFAIFLIIFWNVKEQVWEWELSIMFDIVFLQRTYSWKSYQLKQLTGETVAGFDCRFLQM